LRLSPERTVLAVGLLGGLLFAFVTPPFQVPDEPAHFRRIYQLAGGVSPRPGPDGQLGFEQPASLETVTNLCVAGVPFHPYRLLPAGVLRAAWRIPLDPGRQQFLPLSLLTPYTLAPYLPQAAVAAAGRWLELRPLAIFYLVRLANLAACLPLVWAAVRIAPFQKWAFAFLALTPMAMFLRSSASADGLTFASALLLSAAVCALAWDPPADAVPRSMQSATHAAPPTTGLGAAAAPPILPLDRHVAPPAKPGARLVACLVGMVGLVAFCKGGYLLVNLLVPAIPRRRLGSAGRWAAVMGAALALTALGALSSARVAATYFDLFHHAAGVDPRSQIQLVLAHPFDYLGFLVTDYVVHLPRYAAEFVGNFGWLDTPLPLYVLIPYALLLLALALFGGDAATAMPRRLRLAAAAVVASGLLFVSTSQYVSWTPVGAHHIDGPQGRYFLPFAAAGILLAYSRRLARRWPQGAGARTDNGLALASAVFTAISLVRVWTRYHGW
jgi:Predicted membrane protein (DUF2142)